MKPVAKSLLIITGTMGAGKSAVLGEASDILTLGNIAHAAIDVDALGLAHLPSVSSNNEMMYRNLKSVCKNYASIGVQRFLMARAIEDRDELEACRGIVSATTTIVCRLTASLETLQRRVEMRESGVCKQKYIARVAKLNSILDHSRLENLAINTDSRSVTDVAHEMLVKAAWIAS